MDDIDMGSEIGEMQRLLDRGIAASDYGYRLAAEEESVAGRAGRNAEAFERLFACEAEPFGLRPGRKNDRLRGERPQYRSPSQSRSLLL